MQVKAPTSSQPVGDGDVERYTIMTYERRNGNEPLVVEESAVATPSECSPYKIPKPPDFPAIPEITARQARDPNVVENILVNHIAELREYARGYQSGIEANYLAYRADCEPP